MVTDLSTKHGLVSDLFTLPSTPEQAAKYRLNDEQLQFYQTNGYVGGIKVLSDNQIESLRSELGELLKPEHPGNSLFYEYHSNESEKLDKVIFHALGSWRITPGFHDLLWNPAITIPASQLLGGPVRFWHDQLFYKPPRNGAIVPWHQDYSYWTRTKPIAHLTCWIALDDATLENGCVHYSPGSQNWDLLPVPKGRVNAKMDDLLEVMSEEQKAQFNPIPFEVTKGECIFHHSLTLHCSHENNSDAPRRATVVNVFRDGVLSDSDEPLVAGVPVVHKDQTMGGQFFPILYEPE